MLEMLAISNYRPLRNLVIPLDFFRNSKATKNRERLGKTQRTEPCLGCAALLADPAQIILVLKRIWCKNVS
jgi:hypothetical protein